MIKKLIFWPGYSAFNRPLNPEEFTAIAETAKEAGFTHIDIGCALSERARWQLTNNGVYCEGYDFYPEYTAAFPSLFKFYIPEGLKGFLPEDYTKRNYDRMAAFAEVLKQFDLKAAMDGGGPQFLPEAVYQAHPDWRGPRCDFIWRSRQSYFPPCVDHPEVLKLYREASAGIHKIAPMLDTIGFQCGDSGTGVCHLARLYPGGNGPERCAGIPLKQRFAGLAGAIADGMDKGSCVYIASTTVWNKSAPITFDYCTTADNMYLVRVQVDKPVPVESPLSLLKEMDKAAGYDIVRIAVEDPRRLFTKNSIYPKLIREYIGNATPDGNFGRLNRLHELVRKAEPSADAAALVNAWQLTDDAIERVCELVLASLYFYGSMSERWIMRPLVINPETLTSEERDFYWPHVFNSLDRAAGDDLLDYHGTRWKRIAHNADTADYANRVFHSVLYRLDQAIEYLKKANTAEERIDQLKVFRCFTMNIAHILTFQAQLDRFHDQLPEFDHQILTRTVRLEYDNTLQLIELLRKNPDLVMHAADPKMENTFLFGPDMIGQLTRKNEVMIRHMHAITDAWFDRKEMSRQGRFR